MDAARFVIPLRLPLGLAPLAAGLAGAVGGCRPDLSATDAAPVATTQPQPMELTWQQQSLGGVAGQGAQPTVVKEGPPLLIYVADLPQTIRVVDRSSDQILAEVPVRARTIVRVDQRHGVVAGSDQLVAGPLPIGRRYAIMVVPDGENVTRTGTFLPRPEPVAEPTTQPAVEPAAAE